MFERIRAYRSLKKMEKVLKGIKQMGEITGNEEFVKAACDTLYQNEILKQQMIWDRKKAKEYNLQCIKNNMLQK